jgi:hypothetical protein
MLFTSHAKIIKSNDKYPALSGIFYLAPIAFQVLAFLREPLFRSPLPSADGDGL